VTALACVAALASVACSDGRAPMASLILAVSAVLLLVIGQLIATRSRHAG
jgi:hypothetical protein